MLGLRTSEKGPENTVHLADNVGIVDHDVSVDATKNHRVIKTVQIGGGHAQKESII